MITDLTERFLVAIVSVVLPVEPEAIFVWTLWKEDECQFIGNPEASSPLNELLNSADIRRTGTCNSTFDIVQETAEASSLSAINGVPACGSVISIYAVPLANPNGHSLSDWNNPDIGTWVNVFDLVRRIETRAASSTTALLPAPQVDCCVKAASEVSGSSGIIHPKLDIRTF